MRLDSPVLLSALAAIAIAATPTISSAQVCFGNASFAKNHLQMNGDFVFHDDFEELGASFVSGSNSVFAGLGASSTTFDGGDANIAIRGTLGYQVPVTSSGSVQVCPVLRVGIGLPTKNYNGLGGDLSTQSYGLGLSVGGTMLRAERLAIVPSFTAGVQRDVFKISGGLAPDNIEDTYAYAGVALGFVVNDALSFRPSVLFPGDARFDSPIYGVGISLNYGGRR